MSLLNIIGLNNYTKTGTRREYSQDIGQSTVTSYEGPREPIDDLYQASLLSVQAGTIDKVTTEIRDGVGVLEITVADGDEDENNPNTIANNTIWEVVGQDLFKNLRSYNGDPGGNAFNLDANQADLETTRLYFETAKQQGSAPVAEPMQTYYKLLLRGVNQYIRSTAVIRNSISVSRRSLVTANWSGVDRALTMDEADGPNLDQSGQGVLLGTLETMPGYDIAKKQWLKRAPQVTVSGRKRYSITQEWWFAEDWSTELYGGSLAP